MKNKNKQMERRIEALNKRVLKLQTELSYLNEMFTEHKRDTDPTFRAIYRFRRGSERESNTELFEKLIQTVDRCEHYNVEITKKQKAKPKKEVEAIMLLNDFARHAKREEERVGQCSRCLGRGYDGTYVQDSLPKMCACVKRALQRDAVAEFRPDEEAA